MNFQAALLVFNGFCFIIILIILNFSIDYF